MSAKHELERLSLGEVESAGYTTAVLPFGATEPHNYHLPYGVDNYLAGHIARGAVERANAGGGKCVCLPPLPFGYEGNMRGFPLALNLQPSTVIAIVRDLGISLAESGVQHLFIVNGHGGHELKTIVRELNRDVDLFIAGANWWDAVADVAAEVCPAPGDHANELETCACLHIVPELVHMERAADGAMGVPTIEEFTQGWIKYSRHWKSFAPSSGAGDPRTATREAGERLVGAAIERIGEFLRKLSTSPRHPGFPFPRG